MKHPSALRHAVDLLMTIALLLLMAYVLTDQAVHEWLGIGFFAPFVLHHLLNLSWFRALGKGRYSAPRILSTALDALVLVSMLAQMVSGIAMSRSALPFLDLPLPTSAARLLHLACGYWSLLLVGLHLGAHWGAFLSLGRKALRRGRPLPAWGAERPAPGRGAPCGRGPVLLPAPGNSFLSFPADGVRLPRLRGVRPAGPGRAVLHPGAVGPRRVPAATVRPARGPAQADGGRALSFSPALGRCSKRREFAKKEAVQRFSLYSFFSIGAKDGT